MMCTLRNNKCLVIFFVNKVIATSAILLMLSISDRYNGNSCLNSVVDMPPLSLWPALKPCLLIKKAIGIQLNLPKTEFEKGQKRVLHVVTT